jgi:hypothetical protein
MRFGEFVTEPTPWPITSPSTAHAETARAAPIYAPPSSLYSVALQWLTEDREYRKQLEKQGRKSRGARRDEVCRISLYLSPSFHAVFRPFLPTPRRSTGSKNNFIKNLHSIAPPNLSGRYDYSH